MDDASGDTGSLTEWLIDFDLDPPTLANISTRLPVETGDNVLIGGFIITGTQPKRVILRAIGPSLGIKGQLPDPTLELRDGMGGLIWFNDDWQTGTQGIPQPANGNIGDRHSAQRPTGIRHRSHIAGQQRKLHGVAVRGFNNATGIGLVEGYDLDRTVDSKLANISTRGFVQTGGNVLIAGTIALGWPAQSSDHSGDRPIATRRWRIVRSHLGIARWNGQSGRVE